MMNIYRIIIDMDLVSLSYSQHIKEDPFMDMNKMLQWMDLAKKYQSGEFWNGVFDESSLEEFLKGNIGFGQGQEGGPKTEKWQGKQFPPTDVYLSEKEVYIIVDLPGYKKEDITLSVSGTKLLIKGSTKNFVFGEPVQKERYYEDFKRIVDLPEPAYPGQVMAKFENGLLLISYKRQFKKEEQVPID